MTNNPIHIIQGNKMKGSCLCGAMEYEIDSIDMPAVHCHCRICQASVGAEYNIPNNALNAANPWRTSNAVSGPYYPPIN